jgi:hypothetical protein
MPDLLDIDLLPVMRQGGLDRPGLPGLHVANRPRRAARSREDDQLILYMSLVGNISFPEEDQAQILAELSKTYYATSGAVTSALRLTADGLNQILLKRNLQNTGSSQQVLGLLSLVVLRGDQLFLAQSGPVHAYLITTGQNRYLYDPQLAGRGLGLSQATSVRFFQAVLKPKDTLILAATPGGNWTAEGLSETYGMAPEVQRRQLLQQTANVESVILGAKVGNGKIAVLPFTPLPPVTRPVQPHEEQAAILAQTLPPVETYSDRTPASGVVGQEMGEDALYGEYQPLPAFDVGEIPAQEPVVQAGAVSTTTGQPPAQAAAAPGVQQPAAKPKTGRDGIFRSIGRGFGKFLARILPEDTLVAIPSSVLAIMALAVPVIVVAVATAVYFRRGLAAQSELIYTQAVAAAKLAQVQTEPLKRREALLSSLTYLDLADTYYDNPNVAGLRPQVQEALDAMELVKRLDYQPALIGGLPAGRRITRIVAVGTELYMLDAQGGEVLRAFFTNQGYQLDPAFKCGPGVVNVGALIDLAAWPAGNEIQANVLAMDAKGALLFCSAEADPTVKRLAAPEGKTLQGLKGFSLNSTDLYVLDPLNGTVWIYWAGDFENIPANYFGSDQPPALTEVVDMAATNEELYLLGADGRMAVCVPGSLGLAISRCTNPAPYIDMRVGRENTPFAPSAPYTQIQYSQPPDPSLYLLASTSQSVDRFSLRNLSYQSRYAPEDPLSGGETTAFVVDSVGRMVFLVVGSQVYYANLP